MKNISHDAQNNSLQDDHKYTGNGSTEFTQDDKNCIKGGNDEKSQRKLYH